MSYDKQQTERLLAMVERFAENSPEFTKKDVEAVHAMAQAWLGWAALGRGAKWVITALGMVAAAVASMTALAHVLKDWMK